MIDFYQSFKPTDKQSVYALSPNSDPMENNKTRREFLQKAGSTALFAALGISFLSSCGSSIDDDATMPGGMPNNTTGIRVEGNITNLDLTQANLSNLKNQGGWLLIRQSQLLVVNVDGQTIRAFTSVCTHSGCDNAWAYSNSQFICNCHGSVFSNGGQRLSGPANRDLQEFSVQRNGDNVVITK